MNYKIKRLTYLSISTIMMIFYFLFISSTIFNLGVGGVFIGTCITILIISIFQLIINAVYIMGFDKGDDGGLMGTIISPFFGYTTLFFKKSYYIGLGNFYLFKIGTEVYVYQQGYFGMRCVTKQYYTGDIESLRESIKKEIELIFEKELKDKQNLDKYKNWNGSIDQASQRDIDLEKLV